MSVVELRSTLSNRGGLVLTLDMVSQIDDLWCSTTTELRDRN